MDPCKNSLGSRDPRTYAALHLIGLDTNFARRENSYTMSKQHFHDYYEIYYLREGSRFYFIKDNTYYIKAGDLVMIDRHEVHRTLETMEQYHDRALFNVYPEMLLDAQGHFSDLLTHLFRNGSFILSFSGADKEYVDNLMERIQQEIQRRRIDHEIMIRVLVLQLLVFADRNYCMRRKETDNSLRKNNRRLFLILNYINNHYKEDLSLEKVAEQFFLSKYYLSHAFRELTGFTFVEYVNNVRVKEAEKLLVETTLPVSEVAKEAGYGTLTHFGRIFKRVTGTSPQVYRREERERRQNGYLIYRSPDAPDDRKPEAEAKGDKIV
ncbi:MAG: helix-turn-helix domain-containing protein [Firmicutes bacterium]|nr:helix-turn-helix domain-containing protein [Bacillota bacterium]